MFNKVGLVITKRVPMFGVGFREFLSGIFFSRIKLSDLEAALRKVGYKNKMIFFNSGRSAMEVGLQILLKTNPKKRKILLPSYTCGVVGTAVLHCNLEPVFIDSLKMSPNVDWVEMKKKINSDVLAVILPHMGGYPISKFKEILKYCKKMGVYIIDDAAQAFGLRYGGTLAGNLGDIGVLSFGDGKQILVGGGGVLIINNQKLKLSNINIKFVDSSLVGWQKMFYRYWFRRWMWTYIFDEVRKLVFYISGKPNYDTRQNNVIKAINRFQIMASHNQIKSFVNSQVNVKNNVVNYISGLDKKIIKNLLVDKSGVYSKLYFKFNSLEDRDNLIKYLIASGIETEVGFFPLNRRKVFENYSTFNSCLHAFEFYNKSVGLPIAKHLSKNDVDYVVDKINSFYE